MDATEKKRSLHMSSRALSVAVLNAEYTSMQ